MHCSSRARPLKSYTGVEAMVVMTKIEILHPRYVPKETMSQSKTKTKTRYAFASSCLSLLLPLAIIIIFSVTDFDLYKTDYEAKLQFEFAFFVFPIFLIFGLMFFTILCLIQQQLERPRLILSFIAVAIISAPLPSLIATAKAGVVGDERFALLVTASIIFAIIFASSSVGALLQYFKIKKHGKTGT